MAVPGGIVTTSAAVGNREDLSDLIKRIYADEMPLQNMAGSRKAKAVDHDWLTADIRAGVLTNSQPEGATARTSSGKVRSRYRNKCQIFDEYISVSGTQEAVNKAGVKSEYAEQKKLKMIEVGLDKEAVYCSAQQFRDQVGTAAGEGRRASGIQCWVTQAANTDRGVGGADGAIDGNGYATAPTAGTNRTFAESQLKAVLLGMYTNGAGGNKTALMGAALKDAASTFTGTVPLRQMVTESNVAVNSSIDYYRGNYGRIKVRAHQSQLPNECLIIADDIVEIATLRPTKSGKLAKNGDSMEAQIVGEETLVIKNTKGLGGVFDITPS